MDTKIFPCHYLGNILSKKHHKMCPGHVTHSLLAQQNVLRLINGITRPLLNRSLSLNQNHWLLWSGACPGAGWWWGSVVPIRWALIQTPPWSHRGSGHQWPPHHIPPSESLYAGLFNYLTQTNKIPCLFLSPKQRDPQKAGRISRDRDQIGYLHCLGDKNTENKNQIWSKHQGSTHKTANTNWLGIILDPSKWTPSLSAEQKSFFVSREEQFPKAVTAMGCSGWAGVGMRWYLWHIPGILSPGDVCRVSGVRMSRCRVSPTLLLCLCRCLVCHRGSYYGM